MTQHNVHYTDYKILEAGDPKALEDLMMQAIHSHWQPHGNLVVVRVGHGSEERVRFYQPIVQQSEWFR